MVPVVTPAEVANRLPQSTQTEWYTATRILQLALVVTESPVPMRRVAGARPTYRHEVQRIDSTLNLIINMTEEHVGTGSLNTQFPRVHTLK